MKNEGRLMEVTRYLVKKW